MHRAKLPRTMSEHRTVVLFGDSLTQQGFGTGSSSPGWAGLLASAYARREDILCRGYSGYNTRHALGVLPAAGGDTPPVRDPVLRRK